MNDLHSPIEESMVVVSIAIICSELRVEFMISTIHAKISICHIHEDCFELRNEGNVVKF